MRWLATTQFQPGWRYLGSPRLSLEPSWRKAGRGFQSAFLMISGYLSPPRMLVNEPTWETTLRNWSGWLNATVKPQIAPEEAPQIAWPSGSSVMLRWYSLFTWGRISSRMRCE